MPLDHALSVANGAVPFPQEDNSHLALAECLRAISSSAPLPFAARAPDRSYPPAIEELVRQCLEKDPLKRPDNMSEVCQRFLEAFPTRPRWQSDLATSSRGHRCVVGRIHGNGPGIQTGWRGYLLAVAIGVVAAVGFVIFRPPAKSPNAILYVEVGTNGETRREKLSDNRIEIIAGGKQQIYWTIRDAPDGEMKFEVTPTSMAWRNGLVPPMTTPAF